MDRGAWRATARGVVKSRTRLSDSHTQNADTAVLRGQNGTPQLKGETPQGPTSTMTEAKPHGAAHSNSAVSVFFLVLLQLLLSGRVMVPNELLKNNILNL